MISHNVPAKCKKKEFNFGVLLILKRPFRDYVFLLFLGFWKANPSLGSVHLVCIKLMMFFVVFLFFL